MKKFKWQKKNGCDEVINYSKEDFAKKVMELTNGKGVPVVYDGVGKSTLEKSLKCLKTRGMMISFGNAFWCIISNKCSKDVTTKRIIFCKTFDGSIFTQR